MNILLLSMPNITLSYSTSVINPSNLGLISLAGNLDKKHNVRVGDLVLKRKNVKKAVIEALERTDPDIVGLSAMTFQYHTALNIAKFIRKTRPNAKIALGGYHATLLSREIADSKDGEFFDLIFRGESELSFNEVIDCLEKGRSMESVKGVSFRNNGSFVHNEKRELEDLSRIKLPDRTVRLWNESNVMNLPFDMIESSRGCWMPCNFCNIRSMYGMSYRAYDVSRVMDDIEAAKRCGTRILFFTDDNITLKLDNLERLCDAIISNGHNDIIYAVQASSTGIASSEKLVEKMAKAGFLLVFLGIENASKKNLMDLNKGDILEKSKLAVKYLRKNGILISSGLIIGNPEDDCESIEENFRFAKDLKVNFYGVQFLVPYPKTEIRDILSDKGLLVHNESYHLYNGGTAIARTKYLDDKELKFIKFKLTRKYFKNRKINALKALVKHRTVYARIYVGALKLIPELLNFSLIKKIKKIFMREEYLFKEYLKKVKKLNQFNI